VIGGKQNFTNAVPILSKYYGRDHSSMFEPRNTRSNGSNFSIFAMTIPEIPMQRM
jgi:hypothetical protein